MHALRLYVILFFTINTVVSGFIKAQKTATPYPERLVSLNLQNQSLLDIFKSLSVQTEVVFSYGQSFNDKQKASIQVSKKPLRLVLSMLLKNSSCNSQFRGKYIIIKCENKPAPPPAILTGYIYNAMDSTIIGDASIYVKQHKQSALSNNYGYFKLSYPNPSSGITISFAKENYEDTSMVLYTPSRHEVSIYLKPKQQEKKSSLPATDTLSPTVTTLTPQPVTFKDSGSVHNGFMARFMNRLKAFRPNIRNISDTLFSNVSVSFVPKISTNSLLSFNTVNKYSFNILMGYSKGVNTLEVGGILNIDNGNVKYVQLAGVGNIVSGEVKGVQVGGVFNLSRSADQAIQMGGIANINKQQFNGIQASGFYNHNGGVLNGIQAAGFLNTITDTLNGIQLSGFANIAGNTVKGVQCSGFLNYGKKVNGQLSGFINIADSVSHLQAAGFINITRHQKGLQLSFINLNDTSEGIPVGFFSYVKKGYHKLELNTDDSKFITAAFGTGVDRFYNNFYLGWNYGFTDLVTLGYGIGSDLKLKDKKYITLLLSSQQIISANSKDWYQNSLHRFYMGYQFRFHPKIRMSAGPTFNLFISDRNDPFYTGTLNNLSPYHFYNTDSGDYNLKMWVGGKIVMKFF